MKILYFSSTGNNIYIGESLGGELLSIPQQIKKGQYKINDDVVGVVFPNYYMTVPDIVGEYLKKVEIESEYLFTICSYGSVEEGAIRALKKCNKILEEKHEINYSNTVLMVDNFLPAFDMKVEKEIKNNEDIDAKIKSIREDITNRKEARISSFIEEEILESDLKHKKRFNKILKMVLNDNVCTKCGICTKVCPRANIKIEEKPVIGDNCEQCLGCAHHCPAHVIITNMDKSTERFINPHVSLSQIIESNQQ